MAKNAGFVNSFSSSRVNPCHQYLVTFALAGMGYDEDS